MRVYVEGVGLRGPGLNGWEASRMAVAAAEPYEPAPCIVPSSSWLSAAERRRSVPTVRLALAVGSEAIAHAGRDPATTATVFASSSADSETIHQILVTLASAEREVSPTSFHNSVHNAPAGYWSIATRSHEPATSLCCYDASFPAGLVEAAVQATIDAQTVTLIAYDLPFPEPLSAVRRIVSSFGAALVVTPQVSGRSFARLDIELTRDTASPTRMQDAALEKLRTGNPAARSLPLLAALARNIRETVILDYLTGNRLAVTVAPRDPAPC